MGNLPGFPFELGVNQEDLAVGTGDAQSVTARTQVEPVGLTPGDTGVISGTFDGGFEDALPNQHLGAVDAANEFKTQVVVTFEPVDNEILESFTVEGIPLDVQIFIRPLDGAADGSDDIPQPHSGAVTVPAVLLNSIFLIAPEDSDVDIPLTFIALVSDPADPTGPVELTGEFTVVIDAAADVPTLDLIGHDGDGEGEVLTSETFGIDLDVRSNDIDDSESLSVRLFFSSSDGFDAAAVDVLATGAFLVVPTDGSEPYWEVPSESLSGLQVVLPDGTQGTVDVTVVGVATETTLSGAELTTENNVAVTEGVTFRVVVDLVPEAVDDRAVTDEDVAVVILVLSNDDQGDGPATVVSTTDPANGSVSINSDGTVTFTPEPDFSGETTFDYTIADQDGDQSTATVVVVVNAIPDAPEPLLEEVYEAGLADGSQAGPVTTVVSGDLSALIDFGADGKGEVTQVVVDGEATAHTADGNGVITISGAFWTLTVTASGPDAGAYVFTLDDNTTHAQPAEDDSLVLPRITATISDSSGDTVEAALDVTVFDDGPSVAVTATNESGTVLATQDAETEGGLSDSASSAANFSGVFSVSADGGADGAAGTVVTYALSLDSGFSEGDPSGLSIGGVAINLYETNGVIVGSTSATEVGVADANTVFEVSVDGATGIVTLTQHQQVDHDVAETAPDYDDDQQSLADGLVSLTATAVTTDGDGDTASASESVDLGGGNLRFDDDGPSVDVTATAEASVVLATQDAETIGGLSDSDSSTANFSGVFSVSADGGADGAASTVTTYALSLDSGFSEGDPSGLTIGGVAINLYETNGVIVGSTSATEAGVGTANTVFEVSVDGATGIVTLTQYQQIDHNVAETAPDYDDGQQFLANGLVSLTATAVTTDGDGDTATDSESVDLGGGNLRFDDDGPSATENDGADLDRLVVDESADDGFDPDGDNEAPEGTDVATAVFSDNFTTPIDYGADGPGTARYSLSLIGIDVASRLYALDPAAALGQGNEIVLNQDAVTGVVTGSAPDSTGRVTDYFTISIDEITGDVTFTRLANVWHSDTANDDDQSTLTLATASDLSVVQTVTDGDGDSDSDSVAVGDGVFVIEDDGPDDFTPADASFVNTGNETVMGVLGVFGNVGTDGLGGTTFVNNAGDNILRDTSNVAVTTSDTGATVYLHGFGTDTLVATTSMTAPSSPTGTPEANWVFRISLDPDDVVQADDKYTIEMFQKLDDGSGLDFTDLSGVESGNNQFLYAEGPAAAPTDDPDLVITALAPAVPLEDVNTSQGNIFPSGSIGVGNGQSIANGEGVRFDFVDNAIETPTTDFKDIADLDFTDFNPVNGVNFQVGQFKGGITEATVTVTLWDIDKALISTNNANFGMSSVIGTAVNVAYVTINGVLASPSQVTITGNSVVITGITAREDVQVFGVGTFDRAEVVNTGSGRYDMGFIETATSGDGTDLDMAFDVQLADADGDTVLSTDQLDVTLTPEGTAGAGATIIGGDSADVLVGSDGDDTITGNAGDDTITGGGGDDVILDFSAGDTIDLDALFDVLDPTRADPANIDVVITNGLDLDGDGNNDDSLIQATTDGGATTVADFSIQVDDYTITGTDIDEGGV